jgi:hypothetical protein
METEKVSFPGLATSKMAFDKFLRGTEHVVVTIIMSIARCLPLKRKASKLKRLESALHHHFEVELHNLTLRQWFERGFFMPLEAFNTVWLIYLLLAQTTGSMVNCACQTSIWSSYGGYLDFTQWRVSNNDKVATFWVAGTTVSSCFMGLAMIYIFIEVTNLPMLTITSDRYLRNHSGACKPISAQKITGMQWLVFRKPVAFAAQPFGWATPNLCLLKLSLTPHDCSNSASPVSGKC